MSKTIIGVLAAVVLAAAWPVQAQDERQGPYVSFGAGRNDYDYDCVFIFACRNAGSTSGRAGLAWRSGRWGIEGTVHDFGRADIDPPGQSLRLRAAVLNAAWFVDFTPRLEGALRLGLASVKVQRSGAPARSDTSAFFGLGLAWWVAPKVALEFTWDVTGGEGPDPSSSSFGGVSATARTNNLGVRVQF